MIPGLHLFSDGPNASAWLTSPLPPYTNAVTWANGTRAMMNYRERPELLLHEGDGSPVRRYEGRGPGTFLVPTTHTRLPPQAFLITGTEWGHKYKFPLAGGPCQSVAMITEILP